MRLTVSQVAERLGAELFGDGSELLTAVGPVKTAGKGTITFVTDEKHKAQLRESAAGAVITAERIDDLKKPQLIVKNVNAALIDVLNMFAPQLEQVPAGIDPDAKIAAGVKIGEGVSVGPDVVIAKGVEIGQKTIIAAGCKIGQNSRLGENCRIDGNVVIYHNCTIGNNVIIQANSTIGSTGFGYYLIEGSHRLIPHNGGVIIEDFVEIGANCCVDRAKFDDTIIGAGTKIDNFVQIAHNVVIGKCCLIVAQVGIAGSARIGDGVVISGQVGIADNIELAGGVVVGPKSVVTHSITKPQQLFGVPAVERTRAFKIIGLTRRLPRFAEQLKQLRDDVEKLKGSASGPKPE